MTLKNILAICQDIAILGQNSAILSKTREKLDNINTIHVC